MFEWFKPIWDFLHIKALIPIFLAAAFLIQIYSGYFRAFPGYFRSVKLNVPKILFFFALAGFIFLTALILDPHAAAAARNAAGKPAEIIWNYGGEMGKSIWIFLALAYLFSALKPVLRDTVFGALLGTCLTGLSATLLKWTVLRARPSAALGHLSFFNMDYFGSDDRNFQSFPSGDVSIAAGACFFLFLKFQKKPWAGIFLLTPLATTFARMHWERHWLSDGVTAMIIAAFWAFFIWGSEKYRLTEKK